MSIIKKWKSYWWLLMIAAGFAGASLWAQESNEPVRSRVYSLRHITAAQGKAYLGRLRLGITVSQIGQSNSLIVTSSPDDLVKVSTLFEVVDSQQTFVIDRLGAADMVMPSPSAIMAKLDGVSIGRFMDPPSHSGKKSPAILDVQDGSTVLISQEGMSDNIIRAIDQLRSAAKQTDEVATAAAVEPKAVEANTPPQEPVAAKAVKADIPTAAEVAAETSAADATSDEEMLNKVVKQLLVDQNQPAATPEESPDQPEGQSESTPVVPEESGIEAAPTTPEESPAAVSPAAGAAAEPNIIPHGQEELTLSLPETVDVIALLDLVGKYLDIDYLYDPTKVNGTVTLKIRGNRIKVSELYALTESVLKFKGFAMSRRGNLVTIVPIAEAMGNDPAIRAGGEQTKPGDVVVTTVYNLKYMTAASAQALLTGLKLGASLNPVMETNTLIVTDYAYRMDRIDKLIEMVDQPGAPKQFKFRQLKYTTASTLVPKIQAIAQQIGTETINVQTGQTSVSGRPGGRSSRPMPQPQPVPPGAPGAAQSNQPTIYLDSDERTNRLLIVGQEKEIALINELVDTFDVPQQDLRAIKEYEIQFVDAMEVVDTLSTLGIVSGVSSGSQQTRGARIPSPQMQPPQPQPGVPGGTGVSESLTEEPQIAILETTNSLLVNATPEQHAQIVMVIAYVDRQPSEVAIPYVVYPLEFQKPSELKTSLSELIEKTLKDYKGKVTSTVSRGEDIAIVADDKAFSIIVYASRKNQEWIGSLVRQLDKKRPQVLIDVTLVEIRRTDDFEYDLQMIGAFPNYKTPNQQINNSEIVAPPGANLKEWQTNSTVGGQFFYSDSHIQALLTAIQKKDNGRVLAKPKILVNDNEDGKINTTDTTYVAESTTQVPDQGGPITTTVFKDYNAKIELSIKPHISEGDLLLLEVKMVREDFLPSTVDGAPPNKTASNVDSKVLVPDGKTIILGGLVKLNQTKGGTKVPILGDIPLVGALFRSVKNSDFESKLYIFVKAYALRPTEGVRGLPEAEAVSRVSREAFEKGEATFQKYNDIPGITPKPLEPLKVLEEE